MDDEELKMLVENTFNLAPKEYSVRDIGMSLLKSGIEIGMRKRLVQDVEPSIVAREARRDRFIAAAVTGCASRPPPIGEDGQFNIFDATARTAINIADKVMARLDSESFKRESEGKL